MNAFALKISSPDGDVFNSKALMLSVRGTQGELAIMAGHVPFVTSVVKCDCKILLEDGNEILGQTDGGVLTVSADSVLFLTGTISFN